MSLNSQISELLSKCEKENLAPGYFVQPATYKGKIPLFKVSTPDPSLPVEYNCKKNEEIFVVSDLHISSGKNSSNVYPGTENFFADDEFARFLKYAKDKKNPGSAILIINGDVFDFLRVTEYPGKIREVSLLRKFRRFIKGKPPPTQPKQEIKQKQETKKDDYILWKEILEKVGIEADLEELQKMEKSEIEYGFKTNDYKSVWKLNFMKRGHPEFFSSLAAWIEEGNKLFIVKGNHDLEWYFLTVRNYFRLLLAEIISENNPENVINVLTNIILPNIHFIDDAILIDKDFYVEHGHRYDKFSFIIDNPLLSKSKDIKPQDKQTTSDELNIPFGSFFNRYLINNVELLYPFADNVRPASNILPMMIRERFPLAIKILLQSRTLTVRIMKTLNGKYIRFMFGRIFWFALVFLIPIIIFLLIHQYEVLSFLTNPSAPGSRIGSFLFNLISGVSLLIFSYFLSRIVSWFQLSEPESLIDYANDTFKRNPDYRIITMGHTHNPSEYKISDDKWFFNTGTWIPIVEATSKEIRNDKTYTFIHLVRDADGKLQPSNNNQLMRWNDDSGRAEPVVLVQRK